MKQKELEKLLTSVSVLRVVAVLSSSPSSLSAYTISGKAALHRTSTTRTLRKLCRAGWVIADNSYTPTKYSLNLDNQEVKALVELLKKTGYASRFR